MPTLAIPYYITILLCHIHFNRPTHPTPPYSKYMCHSAHRMSNDVDFLGISSLPEPHHTARTSTPHSSQRLEHVPQYNRHPLHPKRNPPFQVPSILTPTSTHTFTPDHRKPPRPRPSSPNRKVASSRRLIQRELPHTTHSPSPGPPTSPHSALLASSAPLDTCGLCL